MESSIDCVEWLNSHWQMSEYCYFPFSLAFNDWFIVWIRVKFVWLQHAFYHASNIYILNEQQQRQQLNHMRIIILRSNYRNEDAHSVAHLTLHSLSMNIQNSKWTILILKHFLYRVIPYVISPWLCLHESCSCLTAFITWDIESILLLTLIRCF